MEKFRNVFRITLIFLFLIFSFYQYEGQALAQQTYRTPGPDLAKPTEGIVIDVTGNTEAFDNRVETLHVKIANLTGSTLDSLKIHMLAPNVLKTGEGHNLYCWYVPINAADSVYFKDKTEVFQNPAYNNKMDSLIIYLKELKPTTYVDDPPYYVLDIPVQIDSVQFSTNLIFYFELYTWSNEYFPRSEEVFAMQIVKSPNFTVEKLANRVDGGYYPGESGIFTIKYQCQVVTAFNVQIIDDFPFGLKFNNSFPDTTSFSPPSRYVWRDDTLTQDSTRYIRINFNNELKRKDCLNSSGDNPANPKYFQNRGELKWGDYSKGFGRVVHIQAEPDLAAKISAFDNSIIYSPGSAVNPLASVKNIGGQAVTDTFKIVAKIAKLINNIPQQKTAFDSMYYSHQLEPSRVDSIIYFLKLNLPQEAGAYRLYVEADADSDIRELDDVWAAGEMSPDDSTFLPNNVDSVDFNVGIESLELNITQISLKDTVVKDQTLFAGFPNYVLAYMEVLDQNNKPVVGLADTAKWLGADDVISSLNLPVKDVWKPLLEYHRDNHSLPPSPDISATMPTFKITEFSDTSIVTNAAASMGFALVMDYSGSMSDNDKSAAEQAAKSFIADLRDKDYAAIIKFGTTVEVAQPLTNDKALLNAAIDKTPGVGQATALYDGILQGIYELLASPSSRKAIIVYTDGWENSSYGQMFDVINLAQQMGVTIYTIGYGSDVDVASLTQTAEATNGKFFMSSDWREIERFMKNISFTISNFYVLAYTSPDPQKNGIWRTLDVKVNYPGDISAADTANYEPPVEGIDLWVSENSFPDSTLLNPTTKRVIAKFAMPGDTISYRIAMGNIGYESAQNVSLQNFLPQYASKVLNINPPPTNQSDSLLVWNFNRINFKEIKKLSFDVVVQQNLPSSVTPLYDSVFVSCAGEPTENLTDNAAKDTVLAITLPPANLSVAPQITASPKEIFALEPDVFQVKNESSLRWWDIWIEKGDGIIDKETYSGKIEAFRSSLTPMMPDTLSVVPPYQDTQIPADKDSVMFKVHLAYLDYFSTDTAVVSDSFLVKSNGLRPDLIVRIRELELARWRSPNKPIDIAGYLKNIGGSALPDTGEFCLLLWEENLSKNTQKVTFPKIHFKGPVMSDIDSLDFTPITWIPTDTGIYRITAFVDCDSQIVEPHDVDPVTYPFNNYFSDTVTVRFAPPDLNISHIFQTGSFDLADKGTVQAKFPDQIMSVVSVLDQNNFPIHGLADTSKWLKAGDQANVNKAVDSLWTPMLEYFRDDPNQPSQRNLLPSLQIREITETQRGNYNFANLATALIFDTNSDMASVFDEAKQQTQNFVQSLGANDLVSLYRFANDVKNVASLTSNKAEINNAISAISVSGNGASIWDAVYQGAAGLMTADGLRSVILVTAGFDDGSSHSLTEASEFSLKANVPVNVIDCSANADPDLATLAQTTGGKYFALSQWSGFEEIFTNLLNRLTNFYFVIHSSSDPTPNGVWRLADFTLQYADKVANDVLGYQAPRQGKDPWVSIFARPDSVDEKSNMRFVKPGATYSYTISFGNDGYEDVENCSLVSVLPDSIANVGDFSSPAQQNGDSLSWEFAKIAASEVKSITYNVTVKDKMPPFYFPLVDVVQIKCSGSDDTDPSNNKDVDTVFVYPGDWAPPSISAFPREVSVHEPVQFAIKTQTPLKKWDIWIQYPGTSSLGLDKSEYSSKIKPNKTEPLMPMALTDSLIIEPPFDNTLIWKTSGDAEQREVYRAVLDFVDWFDRADTVSTTFVVVAKNSFHFDKNSFRPPKETLVVTSSLIKDSQVKINVFNVAGEHVRKLADEKMLAGEHQISWDGKDKNGRIVGNDVYVISIEADSYKQWLKVVVLH